ncbi:SRPBCC family protein [Mycobacterium sp. MMS18-G62]
MRLNAVVVANCRSRTIAAEPQAIWDVLADFGSVSSWADFVDHSCLLTPAADGIAVGTARRVQLGRNTLVERITEFDPPSALAYHVEGLPHLFGRVTSRWTLRPSPGGTVVTLTNTVDIGANPLQRLAERLVGLASTKRLDALLAGLNHRLESFHV